MGDKNIARKWLTGSAILLCLIFITPWLLGLRMQTVTKRITQEMTTPLAKASLDQDLRLTPEQAAQIAELEKSYANEMSLYCEQHCSARMKIGKTLESSTDIVAIQTLGREVGEAYASAENATMKHVIRVCEILRPEQKAIFLKKIAGNIAATCPETFLTK